MPSRRGVRHPVIVPPCIFNPFFDCRSSSNPPPPTPLCTVLGIMGQSEREQGVRNISIFDQNTDSPSRQTEIIRQAAQETLANNVRVSLTNVEAVQLTGH